MNPFGIAGGEIQLETDRDAAIISAGQPDVIPEFVFELGVSSLEVTLVVMIFLLEESGVVPHAAEGTVEDEKPVFLFFLVDDVL